jgi:hypothetical protein
MHRTAQSAGPSRRTFLRSVGAVAVTAVSVPTLAAEPAKKAEDAAGWKNLFDGKALGAWKSADFHKPGKVLVRDGAMVMEKGNPMTGVTYGGGDFPKSDYEVALEGKKLDGDDFFCTTTFPVGKSFCSFVVGGWGGTTVGLSSINSADASENETSTSKEFKRDVWYRVRIRVTADRIQAWIDDAKLVDADIENKRISTRIECNPNKPFGVATYNTSGAVRNVRVRPLTAGEIKAARQKPAEKE